MSNLLTWNIRSRTFARTATRQLTDKRNGTNALLSRMDPTENATVTPLGRANQNFMTHVDPCATRVTRFHKNGGYPFHHSREGCGPISSTFFAQYHTRKAKQFAQKNVKLSHNSISWTLGQAGRNFSLQYTLNLWSFIVLIINIHIHICMSVGCPDMAHECYMS